MTIEHTEIEGVEILTPRVFPDSRGYFFESYSRREFDRLLGAVTFVQDNQSSSCRGVVRGLHFQRGEHAQAKLVRVVEGRVLDVAVDIRPGSPTFGRHVAVELSAENGRQLFIPRGCAHGFSVLSDRAVFQYKCDNPYCPESEGGIAWDDPELGIDWRVAPDEITLSEKDRNRPTLAEYMHGEEEARRLHREAVADRDVILVTGANGQLGHSLRDLEGEAPFRMIFTDLPELDILDCKAVERMMETHRPKIIINCAAYTNVDKAEEDKAAARRVNAEAAQILAEAAKRHGAVLIHISTDYVFGGTRAFRPLNEDDDEGPIGVYGRTKLEGERFITASGCRSVIVRTAWLYSEYGTNFARTMLRLMKERPTLRVVNDQLGTPTYAADLAEAILRICRDLPKRNNEVLHFTDEGVASWYDFACAIRRMAALEDCDLQPCTTDEYPTKAERPAYSVLSKQKIRQMYGLRIPQWEESLARCLQRIRNREYK